MFLRCDFRAVGEIVSQRCGHVGPTATVGELPLDLLSSPMQSRIRTPSDLGKMSARDHHRGAFRSSAFSGTTGARPCYSIALQHPGGPERRAPTQEYWHVRTHRRVYRTK